jgi:hypothetical protein
MIIQPIEPIIIPDDYTYYKSVQNIPATPPVSPGPPVSKKASVGKEKLPHFSEDAQRLRKMDQQMGQIEKTVSSVKEELSTMRRTLPPFPPGSQERVRILKSYIGLRKLIEQLTIPPEVTSNMDSKIYNQGIHIPELGEQATDQEVDAALLALEKVQETIQGKMASLEAGIKI